MLIEDHALIGDMQAAALVGRDRFSWETGRSVLSSPAGVSETTTECAASSVLVFARPLFGRSLRLR